MNEALSYKVIIVDDCEAFRQGLKHLLDGIPQFEVISMLTDGQDVHTCKELGLADIVLMDVNMPVLDGIEAGKLINFWYPHIKLVAVTFNSDQVCLEEIIGAGFKGYLLKQSIVETLGNVLTDVMNNVFSFPEELILRTKKSRCHSKK